MRSSSLLAGTAAVAVLCASGAAHAARVGVFIGGPVPGYYVPAVPYYYYVPAPPPPPQYIQRGPDGQPQPAPGPYDPPNPPYPPPGTTGQNAPPAAAGTTPGTAPPSQSGSPSQAPATPGTTSTAPDDDNEPPVYSQGSGSAGVTPREGGDTWYFCDATKTYYPYVKDCASGWRTVPAQPEQSPSQPQ